MSHPSRGIVAPCREVRARLRIRDVREPARTRVAKFPSSSRGRGAPRIKKQRAPALVPQRASGPPRAIPREVPHVCVFVRPRCEYQRCRRIHGDVDDVTADPTGETHRVAGFPLIRWNPRAAEYRAERGRHVDNAVSLAQGGREEDSDSRVRLSRLLDPRDDRKRLCYEVQETTLRIIDYILILLILSKQNRNFVLRIN